jgi:hypothetical protein
MSKPFLWVTLAFLLGCVVGAGGMWAGLRVSQPAGPRADEPQEAWPTRDEVMGYLDGKEVVLPEPGRAPDAKEQPHVLKREEIEVLEVEKSGSKSGGPWTTEVNFVVRTGGGRYAVDARVDHKLVEGKRMFYGMRVGSVARQ